MRSRRREIDPETARIIEQRLEHLLLEPPERSGPARAGSSPAPDRTPRRARVDGGAEPAVGDRGSRMAEWDWPDPDPGSGHGSSPSDGGDGPPGRSPTRVVDEMVPAARRGERGGWRERWAAAALSRTHLGVVAVLAVLALLAAGWVVLRARPVAVATPLGVGSATAAPTADAPRASASTPKATPSAAGPATPAPAQVVLHVLGAVRKPGLVRVAANARVADAVAAAGGLRRGADPDRLNLAATVVDGEQIFVGTAKHPAGEVRQGTGGGGGTSSATDDPSSGSGSDVVDLNAASQTQLEELPGVGPVTAGKIIAWRSEHGRFSKVEELQEVSGIGPKTYAEIAPHCRV